MRWYYDIVFRSRITEALAEAYFKERPDFRNVTVRTEADGHVHGYAQVQETEDDNIELFDQTLDNDLDEGVEDYTRRKEPWLGKAKARLPIPRDSETAMLAGMERGCEGRNEAMGCSLEPPPGDGDSRYWLYEW